MKEIEQQAGLSGDLARSRLAAEGFNELPSSRRTSLLALVSDVVREPMFLLLLACGTIYLLLGDVQEALILLGFVLLVTGITLYQERKTENALAALRDLTSPRALVIREGQQQRIPGRDVVRGDLLLLAEGDRVAADGALVGCSNLFADESLLTGESVPVRKSEWSGDSRIGTPGGDGQPFVFAGSLITRGRGVALVQRTGVHSEIGTIGKALQTVAPERSALQRETAWLVSRVAAIGVALCLLVVVAYGLLRGDWLHGFLAGLTLAMAIMPNEFPAVLTVFLALGAWRMSQQRVLTRRVPALETLGAATVLCVDKTGTLTLNQMSVHKLYAGGSDYEVGNDPTRDLPEEVHALVEFGILASQRDPFDPMEKAFHALGGRRLAGTEHLHPNWMLVRQYPLSEQLLALSHVWRSPEGDDYVIAAKGAPEAIADLCHLSAEVNAAVQAQVEAMAAAGLRVLGVARANFRPGSLPQEQHDFEFELVGLVGLADPVREQVPAAIRECYAAGVRVAMITGDHPNTAQSVARQIGLRNPERVLTGTDLAQLSDSDLGAHLSTTNIFARVAPEQKLRLVQALHANGEVVAMTGDGVNDAPALKAADIGIAMGERGTDVAREAAALVALDDDFSSIVQAIRSGRRIFENLKNAMAYILAIHLPIAGMSLVPVLLRLPLVLLPVHIAFLHLIIEPACSVVFEAEPEARDIMQRPPRHPRAALFGMRLVGLSLLQGASVLLIVLAVFLISLYRGQAEDDARALTFTTLIVANLALILSNRSWERTVLETLRAPNRALWWVIGSSLGLLAAVLYVPAVCRLFRMQQQHPVDMLIALIAGLSTIACFEMIKILTRRNASAT
ncbi:MAG: cation-translocating P-type ATPase [Deltaproteobacteria bacterium]|nr:cation-translocating P-type ATPase [Deltaproteobacteria bacterium]